MDQTPSLGDLRQFLSACENDDTAWVDEVLTSGRVQVDDSDDQGMTALQVAAAHGHTDLVTLLIMKGAGLEKSNLYDWTPLLHAARHGHIGCVDLLLQKNANINAKSRMGANALTYAVKGGHAKIFKLLLDQGIEFDPVAGPCELSTMFVACLLGMDSIVRLLLEKGWDINQRMQSTYMTPLMSAAINGHMTTAQNLMERGCDPNLTDVNDKTALLLANDRGKREVTGFLDRKTSTHLPPVHEEDHLMDIVEATKIGDIGRVEFIINEDDSQKDFCLPVDGATPLMYASMSGRLDIAMLLVSRNCDINKQDKISSWTALMQAIFHGKKQVAKYLIANGADVTLTAKNGITAFDMASFIDDVDTDLLRLLASKAMNGKGSKKGDATLRNTFDKSAPSDHRLDGGGKKWWNRISTHFKNLAKTFSNKSSKYGPSTGTKFKMSSKMSSSSTLNLHNTDLTDRRQENTLSFMDKKKSASLYHLNSVNPHTTATMPLGMGGGGASAGDTLKPVLPPFLPQPSFDLAAETWKIPSHHKSGSTLDLTVNNKHPMIRPRNARGRDGPMSPSADSQRFSYGSPSPNSSGGASSISAVFSGPTSGSSQTSSTLTPGNCDRFPRRAYDFDPPITRPPAFLLSSNHKSASLQRLYNPSSFSPTNSATSNSGKLRGSRKTKLTSSPSLTSNGRSSLNDSGNSLGASESLNSSSHGHSLNLPGVEEVQEPEPNDLGNILKNLSLEKYQPIFEKEEVDMDAFLMLNENDLCELGINHGDSRRQIMSAINALSTGKNVQHRRNEMNGNMEATIGVRNSVHSDSTDVDDWFLGDPSSSR